MSQPYIFQIQPDFRIDTELIHVGFRLTDGDKPWFRCEADTYTIFIPERMNLALPRYQMFCNNALAEVLRHRAQRILPTRLAAIADKFSLRYGRVCIKNVRTRWGSCSSLGNINLSLWLLLAPAHLVDYVICHELAHLNELNHGPRFWAEVDRLCGGKGRGKALEREMRDFGRSMSGKR